MEANQFRVGSVHWADQGFEALSTQGPSLTSIRSLSLLCKVSHSSIGISLCALLLLLFCFHWCPLVLVPFLFLVKASNTCIPPLTAFSLGALVALNRSLTGSESWCHSTSKSSGIGSQWLCGQSLWLCARYLCDLCAMKLQQLSFVVIGPW